MLRPRIRRRPVAVDMAQIPRLPRPDRLTTPGTPTSGPQPRSAPTTPAAAGACAPIRPLCRTRPHCIHPPRFYAESLHIREKNALCGCQRAQEPMAKKRWVLCIQWSAGVVSPSQHPLVTGWSTTGSTTPGCSGLTGVTPLRPRRRLSSGRGRGWSPSIGCGAGSGSSTGSSFS